MDVPAKAISVSPYEFQLLVHYLGNAKISREYLSGNALYVLELLDNYEQRYGQRAPFDYLSSITGERSVGELYPIPFLEERIQKEYVFRELSYIIEQGRSLISDDARKALTKVKSLTDDLDRKLFLEEINEQTEYFSDYDKRLSALLKTDPDNVNPDDTVFKTRCYFGLPIIDMHTQGLCENDCVLIFGQTNQGKTMLTKRIATHIVTEQKKRVLLLSFEEEPNFAIHTVDAFYSGVNSISYMNRTLDAVQRMKMLNRFNELTQTGHGELIIPPVEKYRRGSMVDIINLTKIHKPDVIIIDQLTFTAKSLSWDDMGQYMRDIKNTAKRLKVPIVVLTQGKASAKTIWEIGYEGVAHAEEIPRTADTIVYVGNDQDSPEVGIKLFKLIKSRKGSKNIITRNRWDIQLSLIEELGIMEPPLVQARQPRLKRPDDTPIERPGAADTEVRAFNWDAING